MKSRICIIPARGGSKRIPGKNIKFFSGKPIIAYSIQCAKETGLFDEVMVSTDDSEIAKVAVQYGASVPFMRSNSNSNDFATTLDVLREVLNEYDKLGRKFDEICCIYATAPFLSSDILLKTFEMFHNNNFQSLLPIIKYSFPIQRCLAKKGNSVFFREPSNQNTRSQDLEEYYHDAGQFYWIKRQVIKDGLAIISEDSGGYEISELEGQDIDNEVDWKLAELKYELLQKFK